MIGRRDSLNALTLAVKRMLSSSLSPQEPIRLGSKFEGALRIGILDYRG